MYNKVNIYIGNTQHVFNRWTTQILLKNTLIINFQRENKLCVIFNFNRKTFVDIIAKYFWA